MSTPPNNPENRERPGSLPPHVKLPPKKQKGPLKLPPKREGPFLPVHPGASCKCPYCGESFLWPPEALLCPACKHTLRPPDGHAPADAEKRRKAKEKIQEEHDRAVQKLGVRMDKNADKMNMMGAAVALVFLILAGVGLVISTGESGVKKGSGEKRKTPEERTALSLQALAHACEHYKTDCGHYPYPRIEDEGGLLALLANPGLDAWSGPYISNMVSDGWGRPFNYQWKEGAPKPLIYSAGPDKKYDTADDIIVRDEQFVCHPEFVPHRKSGAPPPLSVRIQP